MGTDDSPETPDQSDTALEPVDLSTVSDQRLLFYLAGRVPVSFDALADNTVGSPSQLRRYLNREIQDSVRLDGTDFVRLTDSARKPVIQAIKPYIKAGQEQFSAAQAATSEDRYSTAAEHLETAIRLFEQASDRLDAVNYDSAKLQQRLDEARDELATVRDAMGSSADVVTELLNETSDSSEQTPESQREALLETLRALHERLGRVPKTTELPDESSQTPNDYYNEFGSWDEALAAAGIDKEQALLDDLEQVAAELGRIPNSATMDEHGTYSGSTYSSYFGSWQTAVDRADFSSTSTASQPSEIRQDLINVLQSLHQTLERLPKASDTHGVDGVSRRDFKSTFGSWEDALAAAGIDKEQLLVDELQRVADEVGGRPRPTDMKRLGDHSSTTYNNYFGSWEAALEAAGIESTSNSTAESEDGSPRQPASESHASMAVSDLAKEIDKVGPGAALNLRRAGYETVADLRGTSRRELTRVDGVGPTKAQSILEFVAAEPTRETETASTESPSGGESHHSIHPDTTSSWEAIPANERIKEPFLLKVVGVEHPPTGRKTSQLTVQDQNGVEFDLDIWAKHEIEYDWVEGAWYTLKQTRGKVWTSSDGTTRKRLSSTKDLEITELGTDFEPEAPVGSRDHSESGTTEVTTGDRQPKPSTASASLSESETNEESSPGDETADSRDVPDEGDGMLGDIMSEFEDT